MKNGNHYLCHEVKSTNDLWFQVRAKVGIVDESTSSGVCLKVADDRAEGDNLKLEYRKSIENPVNDNQKEDAYLITETTLSQCGNGDASRNGEHRGKILEKIYSILNLISGCWSQLQSSDSNYLRSHICSLRLSP